MKAKILAISLIAILALLLSGPATAQGPQPPAPPYPIHEPGLPPGAQPWEPEFGKPFIRPGAPSMSIQSAGSASIPLGQPGLSFRYVQTFGVTETPYISTTTHLNYPYGIGVEGNSIWIGEMWGNRVLKYASDGGFQRSFGHAGFAEDYTDTSFWEIADVATDSDGNIWVVDAASSRVVKLNSSGKALLTLGKRWESGSDNNRFAYPISVAFDASGNIYVSDGAPWWNREGGNHRIQVFRSDGTYLATLGQTGVCGSANNQFCGPRHIAIYGNELYVPDANNNRVQIFNISYPASPSYVATIGGLNNPSGVAVDDNFIYIADTWNNRIQIYTRIDRVYIGTIGGEWGSGNNQFRNPTDVVAMTIGTYPNAELHLFVADFVNTRVQQFKITSVSPFAFQYVRTYGTTGVPYVTDGYHYNTPSSVAVAPDGSIYLTEDKGHRLVKLRPDGTPIWIVGAAGVKGDWDASNDRLNNPDDLALDANGRVYVADRWHGRVQIYNPDGSYYTTVSGLDCPGGVAIGPNGYLYVADTCNHTVKIYNTNLVLVATLGTPGESGTDNAHFNSPEDVAVDSNGTIYVSDGGNDRIQVFNANRQYVRTMGETGIWGSDFAHFNGPNNLFVDSANRLYVGDEWNHRIQVFDANGAYLTTIGGSAGPRTGQFRGARGVAVDNAGNIYVADRLNHRIQKFAPGVPGWKQVNINGFGDPANRISTLGVFGGYLYAGTYAFRDHGAQLWRTADGLNWTAVMTNGFGVYYNIGIDHLAEFNGKLYAGVWNSTPNPPYTDTGGEIWRSSDGTSWEPVVQGGFGDRYNGEVMRLAVFNNQIYAATWSYTSTHGAEIWRSSTGNAGDWTRVVSNGLGDATNQAVLTMEVFNGALYAGTYSYIGPGLDGADVWRSTDGSTWTAVITNGFGYNGTYAVSSLAAFGDYLYAGTGRYDLATRSYPGGQIWRCSVASGCDEPGDWSVVITDGFGGAAWNISSLVVFAGRLYAVGYHPDGLGVWRTADGTHWEQVGFAGFGDSNNTSTYWDNATAVFNNRLYIGTTNWANGGEVWLFLHNRLYLPLVLRNR
jgi:sugar lactone lactonase YvrE